jgi:hypothetical protein
MNSYHFDISGAANYDEVNGVHQVTPWYTVGDERAEQWEAEVEAVRAEVNQELMPKYPSVRATGVDFDHSAHCMFVTFQSEDNQALYDLLRELSGMGFCTGLS